MFALVSSVLLASTTYITGCGANCRIQYTIKSGVEDANLGLFELKIIRNKEAWNEEGKRMSWFGWGWKKMKLTAVKQMWNYKTKKYEDVTKPLDLYHYAHCDTERFAAIEPNPKSKHRIYTIWRENNKSWSRAGMPRFREDNSSISGAPFTHFTYICPNWKEIRDKKMKEKY